MRGFITLATGKEEYYQLAYNLMRSYKYRGGKYPFAILCDRSNKYTDAFDDVILLDNVHCSYIDKFRILINSPYEESFFIESDCLVYQNVDKFFDMFEGACDISSFGYNDVNLDLFSNSGAIEEKYGFRTAPMFCPGYFYIKKGETSKRIYHDAMEVINYVNNNRERFKNSFFEGGILRDDPIFFISMKMNECICHVPQKIGKCIHYPAFKRRNGHYPKMNFQNGYLEDDDRNCQANLCHFTSKQTKLGKYKQQVAVMNACIDGRFFAARLIESRFIDSFICGFFRFRYALTERIKKKT